MIRWGSVRGTSGGQSGPILFCIHSREVPTLTELSCGVGLGWAIKNLKINICVETERDFLWGFSQAGDHFDPCDNKAWNQHGPRPGTSRLFALLVVSEKKKGRALPLPPPAGLAARGPAPAGGGLALGGRALGQRQGAAVGNDNPPERGSLTRALMAPTGWGADSNHLGVTTLRGGVSMAPRAGEPGRLQQMGMWAAG